MGEGMRSLFDLLPEKIVAHIFSKARLDNKEAIQWSLVSKQFFTLLQNRSTLKFKSYVTDKDGRKSATKKYKPELSYMCSTLKRYQDQNIHLETLSIRFSHDDGNVPDDDDVPAVDKCIILAAKKRLTRLYLDLIPNYVLPGAVFGVQSLEQLSLHNCCLPPEGKILWSNLRVLRLFCVGLENEAMFENVIRSCPLIKILLIKECCRKIPGFNFKISNLPNLNTLDVNLCPNSDHTLKVCESAATNLVTIKFETDTDDGIDLGEHEYPNLLTLDLSEAPVDSNFFISLSSKFPRLEEIHIGRVLGTGIINLSSPTIQDIYVHSKKQAPLDEARFDVPNILSFEYTQDCNDGGLPLISFNGNSGIGGGRTSQVELDCTGTQTRLFITFPVLF